MSQTSWLKTTINIYGLREYSLAGRVLAQGISWGYIHLKACLRLEDPLLKGLIYVTGNLVLVVSRRPQFFIPWASAQGCLSVLTFCQWVSPRMCNPKNPGRGHNALYDLVSEDTHLHLHPALCMIETFTVSMWEEIARVCIAGDDGN